MTLSTFLKKATARIKRRWIKGDLNDGHGGVCMLGALDAAQRSARMYDHSIERQAKALLWQIIHSHKRWDRYLCIPEFNDSASTKKKDVLSVFTEAQRRAKVMEEKDAQA
jgi:hypothetical protein